MRASRSIASAILLLLGLGRSVIGETWVGWGSEEVARSVFSIQPAVPTDRDPIHFTDAYDGLLYDSCLYFYDPGIPRIQIDHQVRLVQIIVERVSPGGGVEGCDAGYRPPIGGLTGEFGPLEPGLWQFQAVHPDLVLPVHQFTVVPEPQTIVWGAVALMLLRHLHVTRHARMSNN
jgi:hypothetical protein